MSAAAPSGEEDVVKGLMLEDYAIDYVKHSFGKQNWLWMSPRGVLQNPDNFRKAAALAASMDVTLEKAKEGVTVRQIFPPNACIANSRKIFNKLGFNKKIVYLTLGSLAPALEALFDPTHILKGLSYHALAMGSTAGDTPLFFAIESSLTRSMPPFWLQFIFARTEAELLDAIQHRYAAGKVVATGDPEKDYAELLGFVGGSRRSRRKTRRTRRRRSYRRPQR